MVQKRQDGPAASGRRPMPAWTGRARLKRYADMPADFSLGEGDAGELASEPDVVTHAPTTQLRFCDSRIQTRHANANGSTEAIMVKTLKRKINLVERRQPSSPGAASEAPLPEPALLTVRADRMVIETAIVARGKTVSEARDRLEAWVSYVPSVLPNGSTIEPTNFEVLEEGGGRPDSASDDPERILNSLLLEMQQGLVEAKKQVAVAIADEKRLGKQAEMERQLAVNWDKNALLSIKAGNDDLAKQALIRKAEHEKLAVGYDDRWTAQKSAVDQLKAALQGLNAKIEDAKRKKNLLIARAKRAEAQKTIAETLDGISSTNAFDVMHRMEERIAREEAQAQATYELANSTLERIDSTVARSEEEARAAYERAKEQAERGDHTASTQPRPADANAAAAPAACASVIRLVPPRPRTSATRVQALITSPLPLEASIWDRSTIVARLVDALCEAGARDVDVFCGAPSFCVGDVDAYRAQLRELSQQGAPEEPTAPGTDASRQIPIEQRSHGTECVELRFAPPKRP